VDVKVRNMSLAWLQISLDNECVILARCIVYTFKKELSYYHVF